MKTIIAGSRDINCRQTLDHVIELIDWDITCVLCGNARGVDTLGKLWAIDHNIPIEYYNPEWRKFPKLAGFLRNEKMAQHADALVALWDGSSNGTKNMISLAKKYKLKIHIWKPSNAEEFLIY